MDDLNLNMDASLNPNETAIVVAHPDDEALWFSSVLSRATVVTCYEACEDLPEVGPGRAAVRDQYPRPLQALALAEPCSVHGVDWSAPSFGPHGLKLNATDFPEARRAQYAASFSQLREAIGSALEGVTTVFTHNPWGEYGHPDHVQVARVVEDIQRDRGFRLLHSCYVAPRTMPLAQTELPTFTATAEFSCDLDLQQQLHRLYKTYDCWTWPDDFMRFEHECFLERSVDPPRPGSGFRLNYIVP